MAVHKNIGSTVRMVDVASGRIELSVDRSFKGDIVHLLPLLEEVGRELAFQYFKSYQEKSENK